MKTLRHLTLAVVVLFVSVLLASASNVVYANEKPPQPQIIVKKTISKRPSFEGKDWPIVKIERRTYVDPHTGITHTHVSILRENLIKNPVTVPCEGVEATSSYCRYIGELSRNDVDLAGGVTSHQVHYASKYCYGNCNPTTTYYKMKRVENWWTRNNSNQNVWDAEFKWGCTGWCNLCEGGSSGYYYEDEFDPGWNGNTSWTYAYSSSGWPRWGGSNDISSAPGAVMLSDSSGGGMEVRTWWLTQ